MAEAAGILPGRSRGELRFALEQDDVGDAVLGEVPGDAASHAAAAGNDYICGLLHDVTTILCAARTNRCHLMPQLRMSKRSRFITLSQAATKSWMNFSLASVLP